MVSNTGNAQYTIPIFTPKGVAGLQPSISLAYSSGSGAGVVGVGWTLAYGGSAISLCGKTFAQDGEAAAVRLLSPAHTIDAFCIDGNRLRLQSGTYAGNGSTYATEVADFSRITAVGSTGYGPTYWMVERRDGLIYTYGGTSDSRILADGYGNVSTVSVWRVSQVQDRSGNKILFSYKNPDSTTEGTTHIQEIKWTQTSVNSGSYLYSVQLSYSSGANALPSSPIGYVADNVVRDVDLLSNISVKKSGTTVRKYSLAYETSPTTGSKRLISVTECSDASETDCFAPTTIAYQNGQAGVASTPAFTASGNIMSANGRFDFNGDGLLDLAYRRDGAWYVRFASTSGYGSEVSTGNSEYSLIAGDPFGNGRDLMLGFNGTTTWHAYYWNGSSFSVSSIGISYADSADVMSLTDVDGDGRDDLVYVENSVDYGEIRMGTRPSMSTGSTLSFGSEIITGFEPPPIEEGWYFSAAYGASVYPSQMDTGVLGDIDSNGDGRKDVMLLGGETIFCADWCWMWDYSAVLRPYTDSASSYQYDPGFSSPGWPLFSPAHLNSDGCTDFVQITAFTVLDSGCMSGFAVWDTPAGHIRGVMDWNGDGRQDLLIYYLGNTNLYVQTSTGEGFEAPVDVGVPVGCVGYYCTYATNLFVTDANGDGLEDLGYVDFGSSVSVYLHNGSGVVPDAATSFTDGYGVSFAVTYSHSTHEGYVSASGATYPNRDFNNDRLLVRNVQSTDGAGGAFTVTYTYEGAIQNVQGRGFQGFQKIATVDSRTGIRQVRKFKQEFPFTGMLLEEAVFQSDNTPISVQATSHSQHILDSTTHNSRHFPYITSVTKDIYEVGGARNGAWLTNSVTNNTFDYWGNITASTTVTTDKDAYSGLYGHSWTRAITTTISPDTGTNWCLGLPTSTSVTHSTTTGEAAVARSTSFTPDYGNCRMSSTSVEPLSGTRRVDTDYSYDDFGNVSGVSVIGRHPNGATMAARTATIDWGTTGQFPVSDTNALSQETTRTYHDTFGGLVSETDPNGIVITENEYDSFGRVVRSIRPDGTSTRLTYASCATYGCEEGDPGSSVTGVNKTIVIVSERSTTDAQIRDSWIYLDQFDRPIVQKDMTISGQYSRSGTEYDALGRVYRKTAPCDASSCAAYWITNTYDLIGRPLTQTRPQSQSSSTPVTSTFTYAGRSQTVTDPNGKNSTKILDANGWMRQSIDHDGYYQVFAYDAYGSLKLVGDSLSNTLFSANYSYGIEPFQDLTTDIDLGTWTYDHNSLGERVAWADAKSQSFSQTFDALSRLTSRTESEGTTTWTWGASASNHNIGQLSGVSMSGYSESFNYDSAGRLSTHTVNTDQSYSIDYEYNNLGLVDTLIYPTSTSGVRFRIKYGYSNGVLQSITDATPGSDPTAYWVVNAKNPRGQTTQETLGNGVITNRSFDAVTGWLNSIQSGLSGGTGLQNQSYLYDLIGNVTQRQENTLGLTENFYYDNLYRLDHSQLNGSTNLDLAYDLMGNVTNRTDVNGNASWTYHSTKKHAVISTGSGGAIYAYDANGNMISRDGSTITWTSYNMPAGLSAGSEAATFYYGPNRQYFKQEYSGPSGNETTHYVGGLIEKIEDGATTDWRHYIAAEGQTIAIVSRKAGGSNSVHYRLGDHQGSGSVLVDSAGTTFVRQSYSAFGLPRDGSDWDGAVPSGDETAINSISRRGYTGHSMLGNMGLIHMNGRVQDAITGRFLSPDPNIPDPGFTQMYNRYSYVNNNPLSFMDPTGFCVDDIFGREIGTTVERERNGETVKDCDLPDIAGGGAPRDPPPFSCVYPAMPILLGGVVPWCLEPGDTFNSASDGYYGENDDLEYTGIGQGMRYGSASAAQPERSPVPVAKMQMQLSTSKSQSARHVASCFAQGAAAGVVGAIGIGAVAVGAVVLGAPVAAVTGVLGALAIGGGALLGIDVVQHIRNKNWGGLAYDAGSALGGAGAGRVGGRAIARGINGVASPPFSIRNEVALGYDRNYPGGSVGNWLGTGPTPASAGASVASGSVGASQLAHQGCN